MTIKDKGKGKAVGGKASAAKRKRGVDDDKTGGGRNKKNRGVLQFFEDAAEDFDESDDSDYSDFDDDFFEEEFDTLQPRMNEQPKGGNSNLPFVPKEEVIDEEEFDRMMEERYGQNSKFVSFAGDEFDDKIIDPDSGVKEFAPTIWKVKCTVGRERLSAFCLMQKFVELKALGTKLQIISAFAVDHSKGFVYIEAERQYDIHEACKGITGIYVSRLQLVPRNEVFHLFSVQNRRVEINEGMWARIKSGNYKGDLAQVVAVNNTRKKVTVKLVPRIDLQALAAKFGGGYSRQKSAIPAPRLISSSELDEFRPVIQIRRDRDTGKVFEVLDNLLLKDGYVYKKVSPDSLNLWGVVPTEEELLKFGPSENNESKDLEWLSQLYGESKKKRVVRNDKGGGKGESSSGTGVENGFELYDLVCLGKKEFGVIVSMDKEDKYKILKETADGPATVSVERQEIKSGLSDLKFSAQDQHNKTIVANDTVRVLDGPSKGRQGIVRHIYRGILFLWDESLEENAGYFTSKSHVCEKVKLTVDDLTGKDGEPGRSVFDDVPSSPRSPLSPKKPWQARENNREFNRGDNNNTFTIGQTLRIRIGPLKGYLCRVIALRRYDVTVKLDSQQRVLTVKCEHLSEVQGKSTAMSTSDPDSSSLKPFDLLGTEGGSGWLDGVGTSTGGGGWNAGGTSTGGAAWNAGGTSAGSDGAWNAGGTSTGGAAWNAGGTSAGSDGAWNAGGTSTGGAAWNVGGTSAGDDGAWNAGGKSTGNAAWKAGGTSAGGDSAWNAGGTAAGGGGWNAGGTSAERSTWSNKKPESTENDIGSKGAEDTAWETKNTSKQNSSWCAAGEKITVASDPDQSDGWGKAGGSWGQAERKIVSADNNNNNEGNNEGKNKGNDSNGNQPCGWGSKSNWNTSKSFQDGDAHNKDSGNQTSEMQNSNWNIGSSDPSKESSWGTKSNLNNNSSWGAGNENKNSNWSSGHSNAENQESNWGKKNNWNSENSGNQTAEMNKSSWNSGSGDGNKDSSWGAKSNWNNNSSGSTCNENKNSSWTSGHNDTENQETKWDKKSSWNSENSGNQTSDRNNSNWNSGSGDSNQNSNWGKNNSNSSSWSAGNATKTSNWSSDAGNQDSSWGKSNWNSGSGDSQGNNWKSNSNWSSRNASGGDNDGPNENSEEGAGGGNWRGGYQGRGGSDRGGFRGRGRGFGGRGERGDFGGRGERGGFRGRGERGGFRGRGDRGGFGGRGRSDGEGSGGRWGSERGDRGGFGGSGGRWGAGRGDRGGFGGRGRSDGEGSGGRWGSERGFGGRGRGRGDQSGGWSSRRDSGGDGSSDWKEGDTVEGWKNSNRSGNREGGDKDGQSWSQGGGSTKQWSSWSSGSGGAAGGSWNSNESKDGAGCTSQGDNNSGWKKSTVEETNVQEGGWNKGPNSSNQGNGWKFNSRSGSETGDQVTNWGQSSAADKGQSSGWGQSSAADNKGQSSGWGQSNADEKGQSSGWNQPGDGGSWGKKSDGGAKGW
ncbi:protein RNA-directed DNA methylation 3 isoform X2 [Arachis stenosperma]|uniref:protein RNA-directed DNA methylation 3 isoform X2 n=1 Tax=Arachis stenosperma TaxID=217475 RepID=UPI0025AD3988|nr:protein RNA-directed DNA methylation 3 isoform X2 [Arachis stenosperma]